LNSFFDNQATGSVERIANMGVRMIPGKNGRMPNNDTGVVRMPDIK